MSARKQALAVATAWVRSRPARAAQRVAILGSWRLSPGAGANRAGVHDPIWDGGRQTPMIRVNGVWTITLTLEAGKTYGYGFVVDGRWTNDPRNGRHDTNGNDLFDLP